MISPKPSRMTTRLKLLMTLLLAMAGAALFIQHAGAFLHARQHLSFFVVAHPDDWQLFMGDVAVDRVASKNPAVFVYLTTGGADRSQQYWRVREIASYASVATAEDLHDAAKGLADSVPLSCAEVMVIGHRIHRCQYKESTSYHLRLPDGNADGSGFAPTRNQSLEKLKRGQIRDIEAVDGSAVYHDWSDLRDTVRQILVQEAAAHHQDGFEVHTHDPDPMQNPNDHSDHLAVGHLVLDAAHGLPAKVIQYSGDDIVNRPPNLTLRRSAETLVFVTCDRQRILANETWSAYSEFPKTYSAWPFRTYGRQ